MVTFYDSCTIVDLPVLYIPRYSCVHTRNSLEEKSVSLDIEVILTSTIVLEWKGLDMCLMWNPLKNALEILEYIPYPNGPCPLESSQGILQRIPNKQLYFCCGCPHLPKYYIGRPPGRLIGGSGCGETASILRLCFHFGMLRFHFQIPGTSSW